MVTGEPGVPTIFHLHASFPNIPVTQHLEPSSPSSVPTRSQPPNNMSDEASVVSVRDRIAQLKLNQVGRVPENPPPSYDRVTNGTTWTRAKAPPPPPPARPTPPPRPNSTAAPTASAGVIGNLSKGDAPSRPALPPRTSTLSVPGPNLPPRKASESSPALPPRRPSETPSQSDYRLSRRDSNDTISSIASAGSSLSGISLATSVTSARSVKAPTYDPNSLPALPPKRTEEEKQAAKEAYYKTGSKPTSRFPLKSRLSSPSIQSKQNGTTAPPPPRRPSAQQITPTLPSYEGSGAEPAPQHIEPAPATITRGPPAQPPRPKRSPLTMCFGNQSNQSNPSSSPPVPSLRPSSTAQANGMPPPVPTGSRPDLAALQASKPKMNTPTTAAATSSQGFCLHCRDFSAPDQHAALFPRQSVANQDVGWLASQLCAPFQSQTDKARAIFTWLHHNIFYDTQAFFSGTLKPSTPQSTLASGWAVCEGYAGLFAALAMKAGLEAVVVGGNVSCLLIFDFRILANDF